MEVDQANPTIFYATRICGLAPYYCIGAAKGQLREFKLSILLSIYSVVLLLTGVALTLLGISSDASSTQPVRMRTTTSKFVTSLDVVIVVTACTIGVGYGILGRRYTQFVNDQFSKADELLNQFEFRNSAKEKRRDRLMLACVYLFIAGLISMDIVSRIEILQRTKDAEAMKIASANVLGYIPFYAFFFVLTTFHLQFAKTSSGLMRRYKCLNTALQLAFPARKKTSKGSVQIVRVPMHASMAFTAAVSNSKYPCLKNKMYTIDHHFVKEISHIHAALGMAVELVSGTNGVVLLAMIAVCLLHIIATSYFLFVELLGPHDIFFSMLQFVWLVFHIVRLLLIVEPCHKTSIEARRTIILVCEILRTCEDPAVAYSLKKFWRQLLAAGGFYFNACGLCNIDRQILTSISAAIATYLVILFQFKTDV